jgi:hypothetical protein
MKLYPIRVAVLLEPVGTPMVEVVCNTEVKTMRLFSTPTWVEFAFEQLSGPIQLTVEHRDRNPSDGVTAVVVNSVKINDIESDKIVYHGIYYPTGMPSRRTNYVDFNGIWVLDFDAPVYTWLHKVLGLGWIYE